MNPLSAILIVIGLICFAVLLGWLMMMSLNQRNHRDDWP